MIRMIEALNFKCLRDVRQELGPFQVLVGPNAAGKTTFLDVVAFLSKLVSDGPEAAISERTQNFRELLWNQEGAHFELAIDVQIPEDRRKNLKGNGLDTVRYEVRIGILPDTGEVGIIEERGMLKKWQVPENSPIELFPRESVPRTTIMKQKPKRGEYTVLSKVPGGNDNFYPEVFGTKGKSWFPSIRLGPKKSALGNLPEDEAKSPVLTWLKGFLKEGVQSIVLNSLHMRNPSPHKPNPPERVQCFKPDGSNLPWVIEGLRKDTSRFRDWIRHLQTVFPDIEDIDTKEMHPDTKERYLFIRYRGGLKVPSWMVSDGILRLLALTILAYLPHFKGIYLLEEPENGIHPRAVEAVYQSLSSVYDAQLLLASHSPVILSVVDPKDVLCFKKTAAGATDIVRGSEHPALRNWKGTPNLSVLFASGVLG